MLSKSSKQVTANLTLCLLKLALINQVLVLPQLAGWWWAYNLNQIWLTN